MNEKYFGEPWLPLSQNRRPANRRSYPNKLSGESTGPHRAAPPPLSSHLITDLRHALENRPRCSTGLNCSVSARPAALDLPCRVRARTGPATDASIERVELWIWNHKRANAKNAPASFGRDASSRDEADLPVSLYLVVVVRCFANCAEFSIMFRQIVQTVTGRVLQDYFRHWHDISALVRAVVEH